MYCSAQHQAINVRLPRRGSNVCMHLRSLLDAHFRVLIHTTAFESATAQQINGDYTVFTDMRMFADLASDLPHQYYTWSMRAMRVCNVSIPMCEGYERLAGQPTEVNSHLAKHAAAVIPHRSSLFSRTAAAALFIIWRPNVPQLEALNRHTDDNAKWCHVLDKLRLCETLVI